MLADAVCCCASGQWYILFLDSLHFEGTVNNPASPNASLNSTQTLQSEPTGNTGNSDSLTNTKQKKDTKSV